MNSWQAAGCASDAGSEESEESISVGCVRDRILRNLLMKSQAIESENRTLRRKLELYAYGFKRLRENARTVNTAKNEQVRSDWVFDLKSVVGMGHNTDLDDVLSQVKEVMKKYRIDEDASLAVHTMVDTKVDRKCEGQSYGEPVGCRLEVFMGGKGRRRDRLGLLRVIHRLRAKLAAVKDKLRAVTLHPRCELNGSVDKGVLTLKTESVSCREEVATSEQPLAARSKELKATQLRVASLEAQVIGLQETNSRLRENGLRWQRGLQEVAAQVHRMHPMAQRVNGFDVDKKLAKLQSELAGAKMLLHKATSTAVQRSLEERRGCVRYLTRHEDRCRETGKGTIETQQSFIQARSRESRNSRGRVELASGS